MNLDELQRKLFAAARSVAPSDRVPFGFERRIMARLPLAPLDAWALWSSALWRAAAPCVALMIVLGTWFFFATGSGSTSGDLSQEIENTLLAAVDQDQPADTTW